MRLLAALLLVFAALPASAASIAPRAGWSGHDTGHGYDELLRRLKEAVGTEGLAVVTDAGPTEAAKARGIDIPGNRVVGVYNNDFAVRALRASTAAMIEAPIRFYVTENPDATATLSYKTPTHVFSPYFDDGGDELRAIASELDEIFARIAERAAAE